MNLQMKRLRKQEKLTQSELAEKIGTTTRKVGAWESGETAISLEDAYVAADFFKCSLDELAGRDFDARNYGDKRQEEVNKVFGKVNDAGKDAIMDHVQLVGESKKYKAEMPNSDIPRIA